MRAALDTEAPLVHDDCRHQPLLRLGLPRGQRAPRSTRRSRAAPHVTTLELVNNRLVPNAMEPRAAVGEHDAGDDQYTLWTTSRTRTSSGC